MAATKEEIAELVKTNRNKKGITQLELAELVGVSLRSIQRIESGDVMPRYYTLKLLGNHLQFSAEMLRENTTEKAEKPERKRLNRMQRLVATVVSVVVITLLALAFIAQSAHFPETQFELFLFMAVVFAVYGLVFYRIWR